MATATRTTSKATTAVALPMPTTDEITKILQDLGAQETPTRTINRIKFEGSVFTIDDEPFVSSPKPGAPPAFYARMVDAPIEYQALYFTTELANAVGRPEIADRFCKSHFANPREGRKFAEDGTSCETCPVHPFKKKELLPLEAGGKKCQWKGDMQLQVVDWENRRLASDTVYTLTLPTTGMIEFKGTSRDQIAGHVSALNFVRQLAAFGAARTPDDPKKGVQDAINAMALGNVIVGVRLARATSTDGARSYSVPTFEPVDILEMEEVITPLQIESGDLQPVLDDVPF